MALDYNQPVRWVNGKRPPSSKAEMNEGQAFKAYIEAHVPARPLKPGELLANMYNRPYTPDPIDGAYGMTQEQVEKLGRGKQVKRDLEIGQGTPTAVSTCRRSTRTPHGRPGKASRDSNGSTKPAARSH